MTRGLFLLQDSGGGRGLSSDPLLRHLTFRHLLTRGKELPSLNSSDTQPMRVKRKGVWFGNDTELYQEGRVKGRTHLALPLPAQDLPLLAASNTVCESEAVHGLTSMFP